MESQRRYKTIIEELAMYLSINSTAADRRGRRELYSITRLLSRTATVEPIKDVNGRPYMFKTTKEGDLSEYKNRR